MCLWIIHTKFLKNTKIISTEKNIFFLISVHKLNKNMRVLKLQTFKINLKDSNNFYDMFLFVL